MNTSNLITANKATRLRWSDRATKSKILMDVKWLWLKGNKQPYLSVDVQQVKKDGVSVDGWKEQKEAIKVLNSEFYTLISTHLVSLDSGEGFHQTANSKHHLDLTRKHILAAPETAPMEVWTITRFCNCYNLASGFVGSLVLESNQEIRNNKLTKVLKEKALQNKKELLELTNKYEIPLVHN
jgi:hypothetical protein